MGTLGLSLGLGDGLGFGSDGSAWGFDLGLGSRRERLRAEVEAEVEEDGALVRSEKGFRFVLDLVSLPRLAIDGVQGELESSIKREEAGTGV